MNPLDNIPKLKKLDQPVDPVARSIAKPDAFAKPASSVGKAGTPTNNKPTRVRVMNWKRTRGRPRIHPRDKRKVVFF